VLRAALADFTGAPVENLLAGSGADELIDLLLRVLLEPGDRVLNLPPTFGMYPFDTHLNAGQVVEVPRQMDFSLDMPRILKTVEKQRPKVLFLATPNNPDGSFPPPAQIDILLDLDLLLVLDEAYIEFTDLGGRLGHALTRIRQAPQRENLVVLRTFSKWAGLAGLRVGYGAFPAWLMPTLWKAKQPYNVNVAASAAALASLGDADVLAGSVARLCAERQRLYAGLCRFPYLKVFPSQANFILCKVEDRSARGLTALAIKTSLAARGILVRYYHTPLLQDCFRASVGFRDYTDQLLAALEELA
jgi:histidinol-phosphate aminotransferase